jgi:hypothetical protein
MLHRTLPAERDCHSGPRRPQPAPSQTTAGTPADSQPSLGWTLVLRRQPARIVDGQPQGGYSDAFELICCDCGDDPDLDYHHVPAGLQQIRGPYSIAAGIAAYEKHVRHHRRQGAAQAWRIAGGR